MNARSIGGRSSRQERTLSARGHDGGERGAERHARAEREHGVACARGRGRLQAGERPERGVELRQGRKAVAVPSSITWRSPPPIAVSAATVPANASTLPRSRTLTRSAKPCSSSIRCVAHRTAVPARARLRRGRGPAGGDGIEVVVASSASSQAGLVDQRARERQPLLHAVRVRVDRASRPPRRGRQPRAGRLLARGRRACAGPRRRAKNTRFSNPDSRM